MKNRFWLLFILAALAILLLAPAQAVQARAAFPDVISLPNGFQPEGLAIGRGNWMYSGSLATGAIYRADLRTGIGSLLVQPQSGHSAAGLDVDQRTNYLYVAGASTGHAYIYDAATGAALFDLTLTTASPTFINAIAITRDAVYITDSYQAQFYRIALLPGGKLPATPTVQTIPLTGDFQMVSTPGAFNSNGIVASPNGKYLIIVHTALGVLYRVDPNTGMATQINLNGATVADGDGLLLMGHTLYVVQNYLNQIAVVQLDNQYLSGTITKTITNSGFDVPTSIDNHGQWLYVVNARFTTSPTPDTTYTVVRIPRASAQH